MALLFFGRRSLSLTLFGDQSAIVYMEITFGIFFASLRESAFYNWAGR